MINTCDVYTVDEFCEAHRISRTFFYNLRKSGDGPDTIKIKTRRLITKEAAARWRLKMENAADVA